MKKISLAAPSKQDVLAMAGEAAERFDLADKNMKKLLFTVFNNTPEELAKKATSYAILKKWVKKANESIKDPLMKFDIFPIEHLGGNLYKKEIMTHKEASNPKSGAMLNVWAKQKKANIGRSYSCIRSEEALLALHDLQY